LAPRGQPPAPAQPPANPGDAILSSAPAQPVADPGDAILSPASVQPPAALDAGPSPSPAGDASPDAPPDPAADAQTGTATDTPGESAAPPNEPDAADDALAGLGDSDEEESSDDLLDIFKEAKEEVEESSLTAGLDDIPIVDLMSDVSSMSKHLGVAPKPPNVKRVPATGTPVPDVPAAAPAAIPVAPDEAPVEQPVVPPAQPAASPEPIPEADPGTPPATVTRVEQKPEPPVAPDAIVPPAAGGETLQAAPPARQSDASAASSDAIKAPGASSAPRQQMLHVLLIGLSLTLMAGLLGIGAAGGGPTDLLAASASEPTPAVLAYLRVPVLPVTEITSTPAPTPVPTQEPTPVAAQEPTPSPSPTPVPVRTAADFGFDPLAPAFYNYTVEFGDSLTSISQQFDICPDQILWNNKDRDENTPLYVGDSLVLPGTTGIVHTVRPGESVETLAGRYSVDPDAIVAYPGNHLSPGDALIPGSRLLMPGGVPPGALLQDEDEYADTHYPSPAGYVWPYSGPITTYYGEQRPGYTHNAIDIGGFRLESGEEIKV
ncbi:MAG: LysM peptidoglycan-binding domain-containing protein, partial [Dehalococcoidia bacterium]